MKIKRHTTKGEDTTKKKRGDKNWYRYPKDNRAFLLAAAGSQNLNQRTNPSLTAEQATTVYLSFLFLTPQHII
jgi:hypothetical protein